MKRLLFTALLLSASLCLTAQNTLRKDCFDRFWKVESESSDYKVSFREDYCEIAAPAGLTLWYKTKMSGHTVIEYDAQAVDEGGALDRVSDLNCFWMASEPSGGDVFKNLRKRGGVFKNCSTLQLYYVGYGGNYNSTTRFRRYDGSPNPAILKEYTDKEHLLDGGKWHHIKLVAAGEKVQYFFDGQMLVDYRDSEPLTEGHFGFRTTLSRMRIKNFHYECTSGEKYSAEVPLGWIGDAPAEDSPVTFGVPFAKGEVTSKTHLALRGAGGGLIPSDQWTLSRWPDGSVKWQAFAAVVPAGQTPVVTKSAPSSQKSSSLVRRTSLGYEVSTGAMTATIPFEGSEHLLEGISLAGVEVSGAAGLLVTTQDGRQYRSKVGSVALERDGDVSATFRLDGVHISDDGRRWLPFTVRLYFFEGSDRVELKHTFIYDGDADKDYICSMGLQVEVPLREELYNRHIAFGTQDGGIWSESVQPLSGRRALMDPMPPVPIPKDTLPKTGLRIDSLKIAQEMKEGRYRGPDYEMMQVAGQRVPDRGHFDEFGNFLLDNWAAWDEFKLTCLTDNSFTIRKRANDHRPWIGTFTGGRSSGYVFAGDVSGGLGVVLRDFWKLYPTQLSVTGARSSKALVTVWLWSPEAQSMDLRHYDDVAHNLNASYEDVQEGLSTPYGIARTHEITLLPSRGYCGKEAAAAQASSICAYPQLLPTPGYLHDKRAFGIWSLPDRSNPRRAAVEDKLDTLIAMYRAEVDSRHWYGFWDYGDFRHTFDRARGEWMYDVGGYAWDNTELSSNGWLWYMFLRSGRRDIWDMARAMSRHTCEVDSYHIGPNAGLGSRHNVSHWGCGAKEARISQAGWNRFLYYLTADERSGDLMDEVKDSEQMLYELDPMRLAAPRSLNPCTAPARLRIGPDWLAYAGNWMTRWERTGEKHYYDMIQAGMSSIAALPSGLITGKVKVLGFDPATGVLSWEGDPESRGTNHLMTIMGGFELMMEMRDMVQNPPFWEAWTEHAAVYQSLSNFRVSRLGAYAAWTRRDPSLAADTWARLLRDGRHTGLNTNGAATWSLDAIFMQEVLPLY